MEELEEDADAVIKTEIMEMSRDNRLNKGSSSGRTGRRFRCCCGYSVCFVICFTLHMTLRSPSVGNGTFKSTYSFFLALKNPQALLGIGHLGGPLSPPECNA